MFKKIVKAVGSAVDAIINTTGEFLGRLFGIFGFLVDLIVPWPRKKLRLRVIILSDENGDPLAPGRDILQEVNSAYDLTQNILKDKANIKVVSYGDHPRIEILDKIPPTAALDPPCNGPHDTFSEAGWFYLANKQYSVSILFLGNGAPITVFIVRSVAGGNKVGCSPGAFADTAVVGVDGLSWPGSDDVNPGRVISNTLAHEIGHSCGIQYMLGAEHTGDEENLMFPKQKPDGFTQRGTGLTRAQVAIVRNSRFVTYL